MMKKGGGRGKDQDEKEEKNENYLFSSLPENRSSSFGARQKMMESRRKVKVKFTYNHTISDLFV